MEAYNACSVTLTSRNWLQVGSDGARGSSGSSKLPGDRQLLRLLFWLGDFSVGLGELESQRLRQIGIESDSLFTRADL